MTSTFTEKVLAVVSAIKKGDTYTYKQVAILAGSPRAYRAVGTILRKNYDQHIPCHRVIKSTGETGKYNRGARKKVMLLRKEGAI